MTGQCDLSQKRILVLEDDESVCALINELLSDVTQQVVFTPYVDDARKHCAEEHFDLVFLDYNVKDGVGWPLVEEIASDPVKYGKPACVFMSGTVDLSLLRKFPSFLDTQFIAKPFSVIEFKNTALRLLQK